MIITLLIISMIVGITLIGTFISPIQIAVKCNTTYAHHIIRSVFTEAKAVALMYGESEVVFSDEGKNAIVYSDSRGKMIIRKYKLPFSLHTPPVQKKACSNKSGEPKQKKRFKFSSKGLSDISGALYFKCGEEYLAVSVIAPLGAINICRLENSEWKSLKE